jgi:hypothetical protein
MFKPMLISILISVFFLTLGVPVSVEGVNPDSREFKLLLKAAPFADHTVGMRNYWTNVKKVARQLKIKVVEKSNPQVKSPRYVVYLDSPDASIRKKGYILRRRQDHPFSSTFLESKPKYDLTFKFRNADALTALKANVKPSANFSNWVDFEEDIAFGISSIKRIFSHQGGAAVKTNLESCIKGYAQVFPSLLRIGLLADMALVPVRNIKIREYRLKPGKLCFGDVEANVTITVWYQEGNPKPWIGEFSFSHDVKSLQKNGVKGMKTVQEIEKFVQVLSQSTAPWVAQGVTKTSLVYGQ